MEVLLILICKKFVGFFFFPLSFPGRGRSIYCGSARPPEAIPLDLQSAGVSPLLQLNCTTQELHHAVARIKGGQASCPRTIATVCLIYSEYGCRTRSFDVIMCRTWKWLPHRNSNKDPLTCVPEGSNTGLARGGPLLLDPWQARPKGSRCNRITLSSWRLSTSYCRPCKLQWQ